MSDSEPTAVQDYEWYRVVDDANLEQGDFLEHFPIVVLVPPFEPFLNDDQPDSVIRKYNVVIMSRSCDLSHRKTESVLICPHFSINELPDISELKSEGGRVKIQQGVMPGLHVMPPCSMGGAEPACQIVNFRQVAAAPLELVQAYTGIHPRRLRLLPPYREHMAQAFGRFVMRVGLPREFQIG